MEASLLAISPHLDDAVFGCGGLLATWPGAVVVTIFAGVPQRTHPPTGWDRDCGFADSRQAMLERRREDARALACLRATPHWLGFLDAQYAHTPSSGTITAALARVLRLHQARTIALPLGLFHSDHRLASQAALTLVDASRNWIVYADALYRRIAGAVDARVTELRALGFDCLPWRAAPEGGARKARAVCCYRSQLAGLATDGRPGHQDLSAPERYWRLAR